MFSYRAIAKMSCQVYHTDEKRIFAPPPQRLFPAVSALRIPNCHPVTGKAAPWLSAAEVHARKKPLPDSNALFINHSFVISFTDQGLSLLIFIKSTVRGLTVKRFRGSFS